MIIAELFFLWGNQVKKPHQQYFNFLPDKKTQFSNNHMILNQMKKIIRSSELTYVNIDQGIH